MFNRIQDCDPDASASVVIACIGRVRRGVSARGAPFDPESLRFPICEMSYYIRASGILRFRDPDSYSNGIMWNTRDIIKITWLYKIKIYSDIKLNTQDTSYDYLIIILKFKRLCLGVW
jgi:hypothetical protein